MFKWIWRLIIWLRGGALKLLIVAGIILLIWGIVSPVGTLVWWGNKGAEILGFTGKSTLELPLRQSDTKLTSQSGDKSLNINCYIVFLPGVGDFSTDELTPGEVTFLDQLVETHPNCVAVSDVFPYSAANEGLGGNRLLAPVWRFAHEATGWFGLAEALIQVRNLWRFAISADPRYGQFYNQGIATAIIERMNAIHPLHRNSKNPLKIILLGTSGGVEVALKTAPYLYKWLEAKIFLVSLGGVFDGKNGFDAIAHFYHIRGEKDWVENIGGIVFSSRWRWNVASSFNQARLQGHYTASSIAPHAHDGAKGYFGEEQMEANGKSYVELTLEQVNKLPIW